VNKVHILDKDDIRSYSPEDDDDQGTAERSRHRPDARRA
jgi:hypothetical protein